MVERRIHKSSSWNPPSQKQSSPFASRPFTERAQQDSHTPPTQEEIENEAFNQNKFEAFGLQLKEKHGTITPVEQERLGVLQAKMDDFWAQRMERAKAQPSFLDTLARNAQTTQPTKPAVLIQPKLTIGQPNDQYEQEADRVAAQVVQQIHAPTPSQDAVIHQNQQVAPDTSRHPKQSKAIQNTSNKQETPNFLPASARTLPSVIQRQITADEIIGKKFNLGNYLLNKGDFEGAGNAMVMENPPIPESVSEEAQKLAEIATKFEDKVPQNKWLRQQLIQIFHDGLIDGKKDEVIIKEASRLFQKENEEVPEEYHHIAQLWTKEQIEQYQQNLQEARKESDSEATSKLITKGKSMPEEYPDIRWVSSGPAQEPPYLPAIGKEEKGENNFAKWIGALNDNHQNPADFAPTKEGLYQMNCWEGVMYTAYEAGLVNSQWLLTVHQKAAKQGPNKGYYASIAQSLGFQHAVPYAPKEGLVPQAGDIVFFDETEHIALALGEEKLLHLWHNTEGAGKGYEHTTFEALFSSRKDLRLKTKFAPNPFKTQN